MSAITITPWGEGVNPSSQICTARAPSPSSSDVAFFEALAAILDPDGVLGAALARWPDFERFATARFVHAPDEELRETFVALQYAAAVLARGDYSGRTERELEHAMACGLALYRNEDGPRPLEALTAPGGAA